MYTKEGVVSAYYTLNKGLTHDVKKEADDYLNGFLVDECYTIGFPQCVDTVQTTHIGGEQCGCAVRRGIHTVQEDHPRLQLALHRR